MVCNQPQTFLTPLHGQLMVSDLERFESLFENENNLRKAIASLLRRTPGITGVQLTHGPQEIGKDIVFYSSGPLGERRLNACVIKNSKISGSVDSNAGAMNVLNQVLQALDNPYIGPDGQREKISLVYIMSPFQITQTAMQSIEGSLQRRSGQATFCCGGLLLELFKSHWPDFLVFESGILGSYVAFLHKEIEGDDPIAALAEQHILLAKTGASFRRVYVKQGFKQELQTVKVAAKFPTLDELKAPLSESEVVDLRRKMSAFASLIQLPAVYTDLAIDKTSVAKSSKLVKQLGTRIEREWKAQAPQSLQTRIRELLSNSKRFVNLESQRETYEVCFSIVSKALSNLKKKIDLANTFVRQAGTVRDALDRKGYSSYREVQEIARLVPTLFSVTPEKEIATYPDDMLNRYSGSILITGSAGYGKTSFCKWHTLQDIDSLADKKSSTLPVYVPLHRLASKKIGSYYEEFLQAPELRDLVNASESSIAGRIQKIRLYLDGLDEVPSVIRQNELVNLARTAVEEDKRIQVVLTARTHVGGFWLDWLPRVDIREFDERQVEVLVQNLVEGKRQMIRGFFDELSQVPSLRPLMRIPLLGTLIVAVYKRTKKLPENRLRLYEIFTDLMSGGWDLAKNIRRDTQFGSAPKLVFLRALASKMHEARKREFTERDLIHVGESLGSVFDQKSERIVDEILEDGLLQKNGDAYAYVHLSFQEYLAAKALVDPSGRRPQRVLRQFLGGDNWWREVLAFYVAIASNAEEIHSWINRNRIAIDSDASDDIEERYHFLIQHLKAAHPEWKFAH